MCFYSYLSVGQKETVGTKPVSCIGSAIENEHSDDIRRIAAKNAVIWIDKISVLYQNIREFVTNGKETRGAHTSLVCSSLP
jgi:hypothetical protein